MLFLNKLLPVFVLPLGWVLLLLLFAVLRRKWWPVAEEKTVDWVGIGVPTDARRRSGNRRPP